jgi:hypothetical protein
MPDPWLPCRGMTPFEMEFRRESGHACHRTHCEIIGPLTPMHEGAKRSSKPFCIL